MPDATCPKCAAAFEAASNHVYPGILRDMARTPRGYQPYSQLVGDRSMVQCPGCGFVFESDAVRFFGVLGPRGMRWLLCGFTAGVVLVAAIVLAQTLWWRRRRCRLTNAFERAMM